MSEASLAAWYGIKKDLPRRERQVLTVLTDALHLEPAHERGRTCRQIARSLGLDRDSVSPRVARLKARGLVIQRGISGTETLYEAFGDPANATPQKPRRSKAYGDGVRDAASALDNWLAGRGELSSVRSEIKLLLLAIA